MLTYSDASGLPARPAAAALAWAPWAVAAGLLALCAVQGMRMVAGLALPPDVDALRDIGFAQGMLDGNWLGDPSYEGERRFYPPLVIALRALLFRLAGGDDLPRHWVQLAPWLNLLTPLAFFLMARRLLGGTAAGAAALAAFVLLNGALSRGFVTSGWTPWPTVPGLAQAGFFATVWLIHARVEAARWRDAPLIGIAIGLVFLSHVVPAVLLTGIVTLAAFAAQGLRPRTVGWLAAVAAAQLAVMAPYVLPLLLHYPGGTVHTSYEWVYDLLLPTPAAFAKVLVLNAPGLAAAALLLGPLRRRLPSLGRLTAVILLAWTGIAAAFLLRHYACSTLVPAGEAAPGACRAFVVAVHHYHFALQAAWPLLIGFVAWHALRRWTLAAPAAARPRRLAAATAVVALLLAAGAGRLLLRPTDLEAREIALHQADRLVMDLAAYRWMLAETAPDALFVTEMPDPWRGPDVFAVMAAGRKLVSAPELFSHPYLDWPAREALRLRYLAGFAGTAGPEAIPCDAAAQGLYALLPRDAPVAEGRAEAVFRGAVHTAWRARPAPDCHAPRR